MSNINSEIGRAQRAFGGSILMTAIVAAFALSLGATSSSIAEEYRWGGPVAQPARTAPARTVPEATRTNAEPTHTASVVTPVLRESDIAGLRSALQLTPDQMPHWTPVAAALSSLARQQARADASYLQRIRDKTAALVDTAAQLRRLRATAMPLINALNDNQKRAAMSYARRMGYGPLVAMF